MVRLRLKIVLLSVFFLAGCAPAEPSIGETAAPEPSKVTPSSKPKLGSSKKPQLPNVDCQPESDEVAIKALCDAAEIPPGHKLTAWAPSTVEGIRGWEHRGVGLKDSFPDLAPNTEGAWCGFSANEAEVTWFAVFDGQEPVQVITIQGPEEGKVTGFQELGPAVPG